METFWCLERQGHAIVFFSISALGRLGIFSCNDLLFLFVLKGRAHPAVLLDEFVNCKESLNVGDERLNDLMIYR